MMRAVDGPTNDISYHTAAPKQFSAPKNVVRDPYHFSGLRDNAQKSEFSSKGPRNMYISSEMEKEYRQSSEGAR